MDSVKQFCTKVFQSDPQLARPRNSTAGRAWNRQKRFAKALGKEAGRPTLVMDVGRLMGGLVGQSESNVRVPWKSSTRWRRRSCSLTNLRKR